MPNVSYPSDACFWDEPEMLIGAEKVRRPTGLRRATVTEVLGDVQARVRTEFSARVRERSECGYLEMTDEEIETLSRIAARVARIAAADGIGTAYQMGVDRAVDAASHTEVTQKFPRTDAVDSSSESGERPRPQSAS